MQEVPEMIGPEDLLQIYRLGCFPMADSAKEKGFSIIEPRDRALIPIKNLHIPKRLKRTISHQPYTVRINTAFDQVIHLCATIREETWINTEIECLFIRLHHMGHAHSVECWQEKELVGGLYGLQIGGVFCGESMFSIRKDASKIALVHLCARLDAGGFSLLDAQFHNPHLEQFGVYQIAQQEYLNHLSGHMFDKTDFCMESRGEYALLERFLG